MGQLPYIAAEEGEWIVDDNEENSAITLEFVHMGADGVENFITAMPYAHAIELANAILEKAGAR